MTKEKAIAQAEKIAGEISDIQDDLDKLATAISVLNDISLNDLEGRLEDASCILDTAAMDIDEAACIAEEG